MQKTSTLALNGPRKINHAIDAVLTSFASSFDYIFPGKPASIIRGPELSKVWNEYKEKDAGRPKAVWDERTRAIVSFLYPGVSGTTPIAGFSVSMEALVDENDIHFARSFSKVFNEDYARCPNKLETEELWRTLRSTQFLRAIARMSGFDSVDASAWIQSMESSMTLTYEGNPVHHTVVFFKKSNVAIQRLKKCYVPFRDSISVQQALLGEKWIRAVVDGTRVALLGSKFRRGVVRGLISLSALELPPDSDSIPPHESLRVLKAILGNPDMALVASSRGDLFVLLGSGATFQKNQGRWRYLNYSAIMKQLSCLLPEDLASAILRAAIDLAFERKGALFCVLDSVRDIRRIISDHRKPDQVNPILRESLRGLSMMNWEQRQVITAAAGTDGATILSSRGRILDIACMIKTPSEEKLASLGFDHLRTFPGSRSTAAWNASLFGVAVKVSEDGPISIWKAGKEIATVG